MDNKALIDTFYRAFAAADPEGMAACYHPDIVFEDPAFGRLHGSDAGDMWRMLIKSNKGQMKVTHGNVRADDKTGAADWVAEYIFSQTGRPVVNRVSAKFEFKDGKIIRHTDTFDVWKWSRQAMGATGLFLGWTPFLRNKIRQRTAGLLARYKAANRPA